MNICNETDCRIKVVPEINLLNDNVTSRDLKDISVEDLLGRETVKTDLEEVFNYINNKVILVTGGGGSIGSELCRQIAAHSPKQLIIFDIYENNAYDIQQELRRNYPKLDLDVVIASVRDYDRLEVIFKKYKPNQVFHAAAAPHFRHHAQ